jgi:hypothetical protein
MLVRFDFSDRSGSGGTELSIREKMYQVAILTLSINQKAVGVRGIDAPHPLKTVARNKFDPIYRWYIGLFDRYRR